MASNRINQERKMGDVLKMKYKIKKREVAPNISEQQLAEYRKCYLGISINNPFFSDHHLGLLLKWISKNFDECIIVIGDYLHRINESILYGTTGDAAVASSMMRGDQIQEILDVALSLLPDNKFKIYRWKQFLDENPKASATNQELTRLFDTNIDFRNAVLQSCTAFIDRLIGRGTPLFLSREKAIEKSKEYLLEEMAVFSVLIEQGYKVQVYPGTQLQILKDIANGRILNINTNLEEGVYIDLTVKKIKK